VIHYLVAKYVDDLSRNEPINIGVIVYDGSDSLARFDGESAAGAIDLRRVRNRVTGSRTYRAWVEYWRTALATPGALDASLRDAPQATMIDHLLANTARDFYLERGGTILHDADSRGLKATLDDLFARLVRVPDQPTPPSLSEKSKQALAAAGAPLDDAERFQEQVPVPIIAHGLTIEEEVSYAVMNGKRHFLQEMPFDPAQKRRSRKEASHCVFLFEHSPEIKENGVILYDGSDISVGQYQLLELLRAYAPTVDVNHTEKAASRLSERLSLG
jgi:hypothetical protein